MSRRLKSIIEFAALAATALALGAAAATIACCISAGMDGAFMPIFTPGAAR